MKIRLVALSVTLAILATFIVAPLSAGAKPATGTATLTDTAGNVLGTVTNLKAVSDATTTTISGKFIDAATGKATHFTSTLLAATGTCQILNLTLGPVDLNLLGLMVHLDRVVLNITAQPGPGNLLGNLLCAVAGLLDGGLPLNSILTDLLNQIFHLL